MSLDARPNLKNLTPAGLEDFFREMGEKPFRARQVLKWLYARRAESFDEMTDLSKDLRSRLAATARISRPRLIDEAASGDGSRKLLWELEDGERVESVLIPERDHLTLCVSSQVGCAMGCRFCRTARMGLKRNLEPSEIIDQVMGAKKAAGDEIKLSNLVFMGMGEPLANRENVVQALGILTEPGLIGLSRRHLSLSTVGLVPELPALAGAITIGLTVSLNAADNETRSRLMPVNRKHDMAALHEALRRFPLPGGRRITIAYVLLGGVNDSPEDAKNLVRYLHGLKVKVNLIPFNPWPGTEFKAPEEEAMAAFQKILVDKNYTAIVRRSKGGDVNAACGQLAGGKG